MPIGAGATDARIVIRARRSVAISRAVNDESKRNGRRLSGGVTRQVGVSRRGGGSTYSAVQTAYDSNRYPTGENVTDADYATIPLTAHDWHRKWNYDIASAIA
jgi:hypothetical protein